MRRLLVLTLLCILSACLKPSDSDMAVSHSLPFENGDLNNALSKEASLKLFYQAYVRLQISTRLDTTKGYTIFAPVDAAMIAAGLNESTIGSLPIDSLSKLITPHFANSAVDEVSFTSSQLSLQLMTFRQDTSFSQATGHTVYTAPLYVEEVADQINFNGFPVTKAGPVIPASNGYIYPITHILPGIPNQTLTDVINSQPDLSLFKAALEISDSIRWDNLMNLYGAFDINTKDLGWLSHTRVNPVYTGFTPTILAPTNAAFNKAGFHTVEDIREYALRSPAGSGYYTPMDSITKRHFIYNVTVANKNNITSFVILYSDFIRPQIVNNDMYNVYLGRTTNDMFEGLNIATALQFSVQQGVAYVKWNDQSAPVLIQQDEDPIHPVRNFITTYGALYKVDQLFYPNN
jgi:uncharacterized surface protein with fasciclin (FAS1) repeats